MKKYAFLFLLFLIFSCSYLPPTREEALSNLKFDWTKDSTQHYDYYYEKNSITSNYIDSTKFYYEKGFIKLLEYLGIHSYDKKLSMFMLDSRDRMEQLVGMKTNGAAHPIDKTIYNIFNDTIKSYGNHETCHIIASDEWGRSQFAWIGEGLAVNSEDTWWQYELHSLANYLYNKEKLVSIEELVNNFHNYSNIITYPESGSFVKFIKEKYGLETIKKLYKEGTIVFENQLNKNLYIIEQEWLKEIKKFDYTNIRYEEKAIRFGLKL